MGKLCPRLLRTPLLSTIEYTSRNVEVLNSLHLDKDTLSLPWPQLAVVR